jgi:hypothetical protein
MLDRSVSHQNQNLADTEQSNDAGHNQWDHALAIPAYGVILRVQDRLALL